MSREEQLAQTGRFVLGLLDESERAAFEAAMLADPALAAEVRRFAEAMQALDDTAAPEAVPAGLWQAVEARIAATTQEAAPSAEIVPLRRPPPRRAFERFALPALAASVVVALGLGYLAGSRLTAPSDPVAVAVLLNEADAMPGAIVEAFADDSIRLQPLQAFDVPEGKILQVWTLPDRDTGPVSLGTLARAEPARLQGPDLASPKDGQLYEITLEPAPGSPTGRPTGPILVKGYARFAP